MAGSFTSPQFVGRERELARLASAFETAADGGTTTVLVAGTAGIGASRLLDESQRRLMSLPVPFTVLRCGAPVGPWGEPYGPVVTGFRPVLAGLADDELARVVGPGAEPLIRLFPELAERFDRLGLLPVRPWVVPQERRQPRLLEAILGVLERLGERAPVVLALEDLHAADDATRALVTFLARVTRPGRVCVIGAYEPDAVTRDHPLRANLAAIAEATTRPTMIELGPLSRDDLAELIAAIDGERPPATVLLLIAERSGGNPLVAEELLAVRRELSGVTVAGSFDQLVAARIVQRSPECRRVLRFLATSGAPLTVNELAAAAEAFEGAADGLPPRSSSAPRRRAGVLNADLVAGLVEAAEHGFVSLGVGSTDRFEGGTLLSLRHALIAEAISADLLPGQRRRLHAALGTALIDRPAARVRHFLAAYDVAAARVAALDAAERANLLYAPGDELAALELAIELETPASDSEARRDSARLLARTAEAAFAVDRAGRAVALTEAAIARLGERADRVELGLLYDRIGRFRRVDGDQLGSLAAHRRAVDLVPQMAIRERALVLAGLAQALMLDGQFATSERIAEDAIGTARAVGDAARAEEGHAICTLGIARTWGADAETAPTLLGTAREIAEELGRIDDLFRAFANASTALEFLGRRDEAVKTARRGIERARAVGLDAVYGNFLRGNVTSSLFLSGRWDEARAMCRTALEWSPSGPIVLDAQASLATVEVESAADEAAARSLGRRLLALETRPDPQDVGPASRAAASFALWRGDVSDARRAAELGWTQGLQTEDWVLISAMAATMLEVLAAVVADARERRDLATVAEARSRASEILAEATATVRNVAVPSSLATRRQADANLATARVFKARLEGRDDPSVWEALARDWDAVGDPYQVARARWRQAQAALAGNDARSGRRMARGPLRGAFQIAQSLGARPLLRELRELADRALITLPEPALAVSESSSSAGLREAVTAGPPRNGEGLATAFVGPPAPRRGPMFGLSAREREVLTLVAKGRTNREIGERLFISQKTVGVHVGNVLAKMRVSGRVEAATVAIRLGMTES